MNEKWVTAMKELTEEDKKEINRGVAESEEKITSYLEQLDRLTFLIKNYNTSATSREAALCYTKLEEAQMWLDKELSKVRGLRQKLND